MKPNTPTSRTPPNLPPPHSPSAVRRAVSPVVSAQRAWRAWRQRGNTSAVKTLAPVKLPSPAVPVPSLADPASGPKTPDQKLPGRDHKPYEPSGRDGQTRPRPTLRKTKLLRTKPMT